MVRAVQFQNKRVGSTFLQKSLDSHPMIAGLDEIFVNKIRHGIEKSGFTPYVNTTYNGYSQPHNFLRKVWDRYPDKHVIFKLMYNQIGNHLYLHEVIRDEKLPIIHLMRRNLVKQVISYELQQHKVCNLSPDQLFRLVRQVDILDKDWQRKFNDRKKLELYYEDIIGDEIDGFTFVSESVRMSLCEFFEIDVAKRWFCADTKKKAKDDIWVYLKDKEGVKRRFKGTPYEEMIIIK